jgi:diaminopimelate epimerase
MAEMRFQKGQALGNDYIVVDRADLAFEFTPEVARRLCDRHRGAGSDGVILAELTGGTSSAELPGAVTVNAHAHARARVPQGESDSFEIRIINPDGSPAEKSGNGLRIFAAYLHGRGLVGDDWFEVRLVKDRVRLRVEERLPGGVLQVRAEMGRASFRGEDVGFRAGGEVLGTTLELPGGRTAAIHTVSLANPHCVVFVENLERDDFLARAPLLCTHDAFAAGTNVQFARIAGPRTLEAWIWERGAGETLASGSSACAVAAAAVRRGFVDAGTFEVRMAGGSVEVTVSADYDVLLRGPAQMVYSGEVLVQTLEGWLGEGEG